MEFIRCKSRSDIWFNSSKYKYRYVAVHDDMLTFAMKYPGSFVEELTSKYKYKFKLKVDVPSSII